MNWRTTVTIAALLIFAGIATAQSSIVAIGPEIKLPKDSVESEHLLFSLNQFLISAQEDARGNKWVYQPHQLETSVLLDEIEGIERKDSSNFEPYLLGVTPIEDGQLLVQVSYVGVVNDAPVVRANFELIAHKNGGQYLFSSPLVRNTRNWKSLTLENYTFHYRDTINEAQVRKYQRLTAFHDERLNLKPKNVTFYLFDDGLVSQQYFGLPYKLDYNGEGDNMRWTVLLEDQDIYVVNNATLFEFDPHDLWHHRLSRVTSRRAVNHAVDEGIANLYGGSWGWSWEELFGEFERQIQFDKNTDWLQLKKERAAFITDGHRNPTDFMVNALFVKKIDAEKGFSAVWELLNAKKKEAYMTTLEKLTGISKKNYNKEVWKLVREEMKEQERKRTN